MESLLAAHAPQEVGVAHHTYNRAGEKKWVGVWETAVFSSPKEAKN